MSERTGWGVEAAPAGADSVLWNCNYCACFCQEEPHVGSLLCGGGKPAVSSPSQSSWPCRRFRFRRTLDGSDFFGVAARGFAEYNPLFEWQRCLWPIRLSRPALIRASVGCYSGV